MDELMGEKKVFRPIRRKQKEINMAAAKRLLHDARRGVLAVNGDDGYPYGIPINYLYDEENQKIYFHGARIGHKAEAIKACDKVCFTVFGNETVKEEAWTPFVQSVVVFGRCHLAEMDPAAMALLKRFAMKYYPDESAADAEIALHGRAAQLFVIEIEHMSGKEIQEK